jgi:ribosome-binding ATPase YchF (GTP1/OBG family)
VKIAVVSVNFPLGKRPLVDERLDKLKTIFHVSKVTEIQIEFMDDTHSRDAEGILCDIKAKLDLILQDLEIVENRLASDQQYKDLFLRCKQALEKEIVLNEVPFEEEEKKVLFNSNLLTTKPITFVDSENLAAIPEVVSKVYADCGMISFFTVNERELRAWPIKKGVSVFEAAGNIHSDIQRGFIKAEVVGYEDLIKCGGLNQTKSRGLVKLEDKGYIVRDGDLIQIRFSRPAS